MKRNWLNKLFALTLILTLTSCSSTGQTIKQSVVAPKTIRSPSSIPPGLVPYVPSFVASLESKGFIVGSTSDPRALELRFEHNDSVMNLSVSASLWRQGVPVLSASSTNSGWGTAIARGGALNSLAQKTLREFDSQLTELSPRLQIVPDENAK